MSGADFLRFTDHYPSLKISQSGAAYLVVLFLIAAIAISLSVVSQHDATIQLREKERDWLFIGQQYQLAIQSYYEKSPDGIKKLPTTLEELLLDKRFLQPVRHLRKLYPDPLTGGEWMIIRDEGNFIVGVYSASQIEILSKNLVKDFASEEAVQSHADVKFIVKLETQNVEDEEGENAIESDNDAENLLEAADNE